MAGDELNFLGLDAPQSQWATARYAVLPVPYDGTATYRTGTAGGPVAILEASQHVELFDEELLGEFHHAGVTTLPIVQPAPGPQDQARRVREAAAGCLRAGKFLLTLGGEHSITPPLVALAAEACGPLSVLQVDAHADLRDTYGGTPFSHACVMRRVLQVTDRIAQVGIRSHSRQEHDELPHLVSAFVTPRVVAEDPRWIDRALDRLGQTVYVTVDMDGFDPAIAPGVGTPEPGGLTWQQVTSLLRRVCAEREVIAADVVETRPLGANHVTEFLAARLAYKIIAYTQA
jgi:agmatinase